MSHLAILQAADDPTLNGKSAQQRAAGRFYTHELIGKHLAAAVCRRLPDRDHVSAIDPFGGDGRLIAWLLPKLAKRGIRTVRTVIWDQNPDVARCAIERITTAAKTAGVAVELEAWTGDTFDRAVTTRDRFDVVVTNPPWELLKPDHRELSHLPRELREEYIIELRAFDRRLASRFPMSQPSRRFAGWGTNLSRVGTDVALRLTAEGGICGVVCPASLLADSTTTALRQWMLERFALVDIAHWPAEARLFDKVDVPCLSFVAIRGAEQNGTRLTRISASRETRDSAVVSLDRDWLRRRAYTIPVTLGAEGIGLLEQLDHHPLLATLESDLPNGLWAGRELDETGRASFTSPAGKHPFVRSTHLQRLARPALPDDEFVDIDKRRVPVSAAFARIAWRDISRPSQKRRVHATLLPSGPITGNSVSVAYFRDGDRARLLALLGLVASLPFELQMRSLLMTNHVSLSVMRACRLPALDTDTISSLAAAARACLDRRAHAEARLEHAAARAYGLDYDTWAAVTDQFAFSDSERSALDAAWGSDAR